MNIMLGSTEIVFIVILALEAALVIAGNIYVHHFCFLDSNIAPETNILSSYKPCCGGFTCGNNRTYCPRDRNDSQNESCSVRCTQDPKSFVIISNPWLEYIRNFPRSYFSGTCTRRVVATPPSFY